MPEKCNDNCPVIPRVEALERANEEHGRFHDKLAERMGKIETKNAVQDAYVKENGEKLDKILDWQEKQGDRLAKVDTIPDLNRRVTALESKPAKRWDSFGDKILWFLAEAVLIVAALKIGLM